MKGFGIRIQVPVYLFVLRVVESIVGFVVVVKSVVTIKSELTRD